jgi:hypothetical protein
LFPRVDEQRIEHYRKECNLYKKERDKFAKIIKDVRDTLQVELPPAASVDSQGVPNGGGDERAARGITGADNELDFENPAESSVGDLDIDAESEEADPVNVNAFGSDAVGKQEVEHQVDLDIGPEEENAVPNIATLSDSVVEADSDATHEAKQPSSPTDSKELDDVEGPSLEILPREQVAKAVEAQATGPTLQPDLVANARPSAKEADHDATREAVVDHAAVMTETQLSFVAVLNISSSGSINTNDDDGNNEDCNAVPSTRPSAEEVDCDAMHEAKQPPALTDSTEEDNAQASSPAENC